MLGKLHGLKQLLSTPTALFVSLLFINFAFRLFISPLGYHVDMLSNAKWGEWIYLHGPRGFYNETTWIYSWPSQPPLISLVYGLVYHLYGFIRDAFVFLSTYVVSLVGGHMRWWFGFVSWFGTGRYPSSDIFIGYLLTIKLLAILADIGIAVVIYLLAKSTSSKRAILLAGLYLISPFSWYLSALWGQYDQISFLTLLLALLLLVRRSFIFAALLFIVSISLKPTSLLFLPAFTFFFIGQKPRLIIAISAIALSIVVTLGTVLLFTKGPFFEFVSQTLFPKIFLKSDFRVSTNSFNFWHIIIGNNAFKDERLFLFIPSNIWGLAIFAGLHYIALRFFKKVTIENVFISFFIIGAGGWLFLTNMLERYYFAGIVFGLLATIYTPHLLKYWLVMTIIFWINLYHGWWFPKSFEPLKHLLEWQNGIVTRFLSLANVLIFGRIVWLVMHSKHTPVIARSKGRTTKQSHILESMRLPRSISFRSQ